MYPPNCIVNNCHTLYIWSITKNLPHGKMLMSKKQKWYIRENNPNDTYSTLQVYQRSYSQVRHIPPKMSDKFESQHSLSLTIWSDILVLVWHFGWTWEWILKDFFLHFSRWICQTFCDRCIFVSVLSFRCVECAGT
jgi:hypothetical protein